MTRQAAIGLCRTAHLGNVKKPVGVYAGKWPSTTWERLKHKASVARADAGKFGSAGRIRTYDQPVNSQFITFDYDPQ